MGKKLITVSGFIVIIALVVFTVHSTDEKRESRKPIRVYASMVADVFHYGHVNFLRQAKAEGDYLIVGLISDEDAAPYKRRPVFSLDERVKVVQGCKYVDEVLPNAPLEATEEWLKKHKIDLVVHGDDFDQTKIERFFSYPYKNGMLRIVPYTPGISTSEVIGRVKQRISQGEL